MKTELIPHIGINLATKKEQAHQQSFVHYDGKRVGLIGWKEGSKVVFTVTLSPFEMDVICSQVSTILKAETEYVEAPSLVDVDPETLTEKSIYDEFNESDLT